MLVSPAGRRLTLGAGLKHRSRDPQLATSTGEGNLPEPDPLVGCWLRPLILEILDREGVVALQHVDAGPALLGDGLPILPGTDAQRDDSPPERIRRGADDLAVLVRPQPC